MPTLFTLGTDEITFIYLEGEVGPYSASEIRAVIPFSEIKDLMK
ncbi:MAG: DUF3298 domain-containing protein [Paludibacteraceae bacterium]|nr:DUF3298 domain-containing protein [Paludibacteraceae bacterium]